MISFLISTTVVLNFSRAIDGDTLLTKDNQKVRLIHIDSPELKQPYGIDARDFCNSKVHNQSLTVNLRNYKDRYGRMLGEVILPDGANLNTTLVQQGYAWTYKYKTLDKVQKDAMINKRGLWADPVPPWVFRARKK